MLDDYFHSNRIDKIFTNFKKIFVKVAWKCLQKSQNRVQLYCEIINKSKFLTLFLKISENMKKVLEKDKGFKHWRKASNG
ncbi:hypothetical protein HMPREF2686_03475 [Streptococcus sp. HMSC057G03]|nr:hypothetical protein HMPREF2686_03475 [Streptococcus sp. HMSC057G03]